MNKKGYATLIEVYKKARIKGEIPVVSTEELKKLGIKDRNKSFVVNNLAFSRQMYNSGSYGIELNNRNLDLNGVPIEENKGFMALIKDKARNKRASVSRKEYLAKDVDLKAMTYKYGNLKLSALVLASDYRIELIDKKRDESGLLLPEYITMKMVLKFFDELKISKTVYQDREPALVDKAITPLLQEHFKAVRKERNADNSRLDIVFGNKDFVIEIKKASGLKSKADKDKVVGQVVRYLEKLDRKKFLLLIIGTEVEFDKDTDVKDCIERCRKHGSEVYKLIVR